MENQNQEITITLSASEAKGLIEMARAQARSVSLTLAGIIRQELHERGFIKDGVQVNESQDKKFVRLDEVMGNSIQE